MLVYRADEGRSEARFPLRVRLQVPPLLLGEVKIGQALLELTDPHKGNFRIPDIKLASFPVAVQLMPEDAHDDGHEA